MAESGLILKAVLGNELCKISLGACGHKTGTAFFKKKRLAGEMLGVLCRSNLLSIGTSKSAISAIVIWNSLSEKSFKTFI